MHAYEFQVSDQSFDSAAPRYVHPRLMGEAAGDDRVHNAAAATLDGVGLKTGRTFLYWFDFGDDWRHGITVKEIMRHALALVRHTNLFSAVERSKRRVFP